MNLNDSIYLIQPNSFLSRPTFVGIENIWMPELSHILHTEPDLTDWVEVERFFVSTHPRYIILKAGWSGGILANQMFAALLTLWALQIIVNIIDYAYKYREKLLLFGSLLLTPSMPSNQCLLSNWWLVNWGQPIKPTLWLHLQASRCANRTHSSIGLIV